jgi:hypothetical protein
VEPSHRPDSRKASTGRSYFLAQLLSSISLLENRGLVVISAESLRSVICFPVQTNGAEPQSSGGIPCSVTEKPAEKLAPSSHRFSNHVVF